LGERLLCKQEVVGSIPSGSTSRDHFGKTALQRQLRLVVAACLAAVRRKRLVRRENNSALAGKLKRLGASPWYLTS
jgi:hypothetical protein